MIVYALRYFAMEVLDIVEPPYSKEFIDVFLPIVSNEEIFHRKVQDKSDRLIRAKEFKEHCMAAVFDRS